MPWSDHTDKENVADRILRRRTINQATGCWLWTGAVMKNGYGVIGAKILGLKSTNLLVHRASAWCFLNFDILSDLQVLHKCDVRHCFNPSHLFIGSQLDNITDMWEKGRGPNQRHPRKLTSETVKEIRQRYLSGGTTTRKLASIYGLGKSTIGTILLRQIWSHI